MKHFLLALLCFACVGHSAYGAPKKIQAVCTIGMITDIVQNVGGDRVDAVGLMGPGVDPHLYRASEGDVGKLSKADMVFYNGLHLEAKMGEILEKMGRFKTTVAVTDLIPKEKLLSPAQFQGQHDPHVWFDVQFWMLATLKVRDALIKKDPAYKAEYETRANAHLAKLEALDKKIKKDVESVPKKQRIVVTAHDAFNYFGRAYGFEVVGLQGISTESEAGTKDVQDLVNFIIQNKVKSIFIESSLPKRNIIAVQQAAKAKGWEVKVGGELFSDAMGRAGTHEGTYIGMIEHNIKTIVEGLR